MTETQTEQQRVEAVELREKHLANKDFIKKDYKFKTAPAQLRTGEIADIMVYLRELKSLVEAREKLLNGALQSRHLDQLKELERAFYEDGEILDFEVRGEATSGVKYIFVEQNRLDQDAITEEMGADWMEDHKKKVSFYQAKQLKD